MNRLESELRAIQQQFGEIDVAPDLSWIVIKTWPLLHGWDRGAIRVLIRIPSGYPATPPDNFFTDNDLRLNNGQLPGATTPNQAHIGQQWLQFSYHVEGADWKPHKNILEGHNLLTFLAGISVRLSETS